MTNPNNGFLEHLAGLARDLFGDLVDRKVAEAKRGLIRDARSAALGMTALSVAVVFGAVGARQWLETIVSPGHAWAPSFLVAVMFGLAGWAVLRAASGRREP